MFEITTLQDFLETLSILGFYRCSQPEKEPRYLCFRFVNPFFREGCEVPEDLYKLTVDPSKMRNKKRILSVKSIQLLQRLERMKSKHELKITKLEFAKVQLKFALQKRLQTLQENHEIIEHAKTEPEYVKEKKIAGYYGDVKLEALEKAFCDFFPIYELIEAPTKDESMQVDELEGFAPLIYDDDGPKPESPTVPEVDTEVIVEADKKPKGKKRKLNNPTGHFKETEQALMCLFKETQKKMKDREE